MKISIITIIVSFILDGIISNFISLDSYLKPLFTVVSLIIIYPFLHNKQNEYLKIAFITGILYDIIYTNTIFLNAIIFILLAFTIIKINVFITNNFINVGFISLFIVIIYKIVNFFILVIIGYLNLNFNVLLNSIIKSLLLNILYTVVAYFITDKIARKNNIYKID